MKVSRMLVSFSLYMHNYIIGSIYSLFRKTVNARENFWNVYCFATNQMQDETEKKIPDKPQNGLITTLHETTSSLFLP